MSKTHTFDDRTEMSHDSKKANGNTLDGEQHLAAPFAKKLTTAEKRNAAKLTTDERKEWRRALNTIEKGWKGFIEVGQALRKIRESRLYREAYESWENFCREVIGRSKTEANRQIRNAEVIEDLMAPIGATGVGSEILPANPAQARALALLKTPDERREVWNRAVANAGSAPVTAKLIEATVRDFTGNEPPRTPSSTHRSKLGDSTEQRPSDTIDVLKQLRLAREREDWSLVDEVIAALADLHVQS